MEVDHLERNRLVAEDEVEIDELLRRNGDRGRSQWCPSSENAKLEGVFGRSPKLNPIEAVGELWYALKMELKGELGQESRVSASSSSRRSKSSMSICINSSTSQGMEERGGGRLETGVDGMVVVVVRQGDETARTLLRGDGGQT